MLDQFYIKQVRSILKFGTILYINPPLGPDMNTECCF